MRLRLAMLLLAVAACDRARTEPTALPETERSAPQNLTIADQVALRDVRDTAGPFAIDADGVLWRIEERHRTRVVDHARRVVLHPDGPLVVREGTAPGETSLWLNGRELAPAPGADDQPFVLPDGRIVFVSTRTTVASVWILDGGEARQLTNVGLVAGRPLDGFVPPPVDGFELVDGRLEYDAPDRRVRLELP